MPNTQKGLVADTEKGACPLCALDLDIKYTVSEQHNIHLSVYISLHLQYIQCIGYPHNILVPLLRISS